MKVVPVPYFNSSLQRLHLVICSLPFLLSEKPSGSLQVLRFDRNLTIAAFSSFFPIARGDYARVLSACVFSYVTAR